MIFWEPRFVYRDLTGSAEVSIDDRCLYGKVFDIVDEVTYEGNTVDELEENFHKAVDTYLEDLEKQGVRLFSRTYLGVEEYKEGYEEGYRLGVAITYNEGKISAAGAAGLLKMDENEFLKFFEGLDEEDLQWKRS